MRKLLIVLFCWLCLCTPVYAVNFVEIVRDDQYLIYVDVDSIELRTSYNHEYVVAWNKWIYRGDRAKVISKELKKTVDHSMDFVAYNKNMKQEQLLSLHYYDKNGNVIDSFSWPFKISEYSEIVPDSYGDTIYDFIISYNRRTK